MITERELEIISFIDKFKCASTTCIKDLFFPTSPLRYAQKRLKMLTDDYGELDRDRKSIMNEYCYYIKGRKPRQIIHSLLLTEFYRHLSKHAKILKFDVEYTMGSLRADGFVIYEYNGVARYSFVEIDLTKNRFDLDKYLTVARTEEYLSHNFSKMPSLIVVTKKNIPEPAEFKLKRVAMDFSNIEDIFKG